MNLGITLLEAIATAAGAAILAGLVAIVRMLFDIKRGVAKLTPSVQALYAIQPYIIDATRYQNKALQELGANGSTEKSDGCLDQAVEIYRGRTVESIGECR